VALLLQRGVARHGKLYLWRCDRQGILGYKKKKKVGYCDVSALAVRRKQRKWLAEQQVSGGKMFWHCGSIQVTVAMPLSSEPRTARRARNLVGTQAVELDDRSVKHTSVMASRLISELQCSVSRPVLEQEGALHRATTWRYGCTTTVSLVMPGEQLSKIE
jgi:hypothetical protein